MKKIISLILATLLVCSVIMPATSVLAADTTILYETSTTWFPITEATGGNAEYFLAKGSNGLNVGDNKKDFLPMVDFGGASKRYSADEASAAGYSSGVGYYPTGADTVVSGQLGAFGYTIDAGTDNTKAVSYVDLTTKADGLTYWNINGKDYAIGVNGRIIKLLANVRTELITDEAIKARYESLKGVTFDVTDGYYDSVGFLIAMSSSSSRTFKYKLVYADGTTSTLTSPALKDDNYSNSASKYASQGFIYRQLMNPTEEDMKKPGTTNGGGNSRYLPIVVDTDVTRKLTAIELIASTDWEVLYFTSAWGEKPSIKVQLEKVTDAKDLTEENYAKAQSALKNFMEYVEACGLTYADLDAEMKAKVDAINNPFPQIMANIIATLDETAEITAENLYTYKEALAEIEAYRVEKELTYTSAQETKLNTVKANIQAVEHSIVVADINNRIAQLPSADTVTAENFEEVSLMVQEINNIIKEYGIEEEINTEAIETLQAKLDVVILDITKIIPLDIQNGANAKMFLEKGEIDNDYVEWRDYITGNWFSKVEASTKWAGKVIRYSETEPEAMSQPYVYAPNKIWTIKGIPYRIGSDVKGIRLHGARTVTTGDEALSILMSSYKTATIDLEKGLYSKLYLSATNYMGNSGSPNSTVSYVLTYKDGSKAEGALSINYNPETTTYLPSDGYVTRTSVNEDAASGAMRFDNYVIETDPTKQIDTLRLSSSDTNRIIYIVGISGETAKIGDVKSLLEEKLASYNGVTVGTAAKSALYDIEGLVNQYKSVGGDISAFEGIEGFEADLSELKAGLVEAKDYNYDIDFENTYFEHSFSKDITIDAKNISVTKNSTGLAENAYTLTVEGNKLKVVIPDDHSKDASYKVIINAKAILNKANANFYVDTAIEVSFDVTKPVEITKFALEEGTITVNVTNNMKANKQKYLLVLAAYDKDNKLVGVSEVKGELKTEETIEAALDASAFEEGAVVECYLADTIDNLKYLDTVAAITIAQ